MFFNGSVSCCPVATFVGRAMGERQVSKGEGREDIKPHLNDFRDEN